MLISVVTLGSILLAGANSIFNSKSLSVSETFQDQINSVKEDFIIEEVKFKSGSGSVSMGPGDGRIVYGVSATPYTKTRLWLSSSNTWGTETNANSVKNVQLVATKVSPIGSGIVTLLANSTIASTGYMHVQRFDGTQWISDWMHDVDYGTTDVGRSFDIEFEQLSGRALVVYRDGTVAGGDNLPHYRVWDGSAWTADAKITNPNAPTGTISWIKLTAKPNSNEIALAWSDTTSIKVIFWNGNSWVNPTNPPLVTDLNSANIHKFDIAYEQGGNNELLAVFSSSTTANQLRYRTWDGSAWSAVQTVTDNLGGKPKQILLAPDPASDDIFLGTCTDAATPSLWAATWNGASMTSVTQIDPIVFCDQWIQGLGNNFALTAVGNSGKAVIVYNDSDGTLANLDWVLWNGSTWAPQTDVSASLGVTGSVGIDVDSVKGVNKAVATSNAFTGDLYGFYYDGTSWFPTNSGAAIQTGSMPSGVKPFDLAIIAVSSSSGTQVQLALTNVGEISVTVTKIYFNNVLQWTGSTTILPKNFATINVNFSWQTGSYEIKVETSRENLLTQVWKAA